VILGGPFLREIIRPAPIAGVYLLASFSPTCGKFYVGQSRNVLGRLLNHSSQMNFGPGFSEPRMVLLLNMSELPSEWTHIPKRPRFDDEARYIAEARFIFAAKRLNLPLMNLSIPDYFEESVNLNYEVACLEKAVAFRRPISEPETLDGYFDLPEDSNEDAPW